MNVENTIKLSRWVVENRNSFVGDNTTQKDKAMRAEKALGFKISPGAMADVLRLNNLPTGRRNKQEAKIEQLERENSEIRDWLLRMLDTTAVQDWLLDEMAKVFVNDTGIS